MAREIGMAAMQDDVAAVTTGRGHVREHLEAGRSVAGGERRAGACNRDGENGGGEETAGHCRAETGLRPIS